MTWVWIERAVIVAAHAEQLAEHGGPEGLWDEGLLHSALARPVNLAATGKPDASDLAAAYAFGIARKHPFLDGNKRTALVALELFLDPRPPGLATGVRQPGAREGAHPRGRCASACASAADVTPAWKKRAAGGVTCGSPP